MRAMRTLCAIALAASESADRIQVKSPVEPGAFASPCRMCDCSEVMFQRASEEGGAVVFAMRTDVTIDKRQLVIGNLKRIANRESI